MVNDQANAIDEQSQAVVMRHDKGVVPGVQEELAGKSNKSVVETGVGGSKLAEVLKNAGAFRNPTGV